MLVSSVYLMFPYSRDRFATFNPMSQNKLQQQQQQQQHSQERSGMQLNGYQFSPLGRSACMQVNLIYLKFSCSRKGFQSWVEIFLVSMKLVQGIGLHAGHCRLMSLTSYVVNDAVEFQSWRTVT